MGKYHMATLKQIVPSSVSKVCHLNPYLFTVYLQRETVGVKSADLSVRHAWVSQIVLFDMPKTVR